MAAERSSPATTAMRPAHRCCQRAMTRCVSDDGRGSFRAVPGQASRQPQALVVGGPHLPHAPSRAPRVRRRGEYVLACAVAKHDCVCVAAAAAAVTVTVARRVAVDGGPIGSVPHRGHERNCCCSRCRWCRPANCCRMPQLRSVPACRSPPRNRRSGAPRCSRRHWHCRPAAAAFGARTTAWRGNPDAGPPTRPAAPAEALRPWRAGGGPRRLRRVRVHVRGLLQQHGPRL